MVSVCLASPERHEYLHSLNDHARRSTSLLHLGQGVNCSIILLPPPGAKVNNRMPAMFAAEFTVLVINIEAGPTLVGAIELVSPSNKARPAARRAFAMKCLNYINASIGLIMVDVVTRRRANLHDQMARLIVGNAPRFPGTSSTYAAAYRPFRRGDAEKVSIWPVTLTVGEPLPVLPLWLREVEQPVRVDLEAAYTEARQRGALG